MKESDNNQPYLNFDIDESKMHKKEITEGQLLEMKKIHDQNDDVLLEQLSGQAKQIKEGQLVIKQVIKQQDPLLENINEDFDRVGNKLQMENNKLKKYLEKTSTSCLYWVIGIQLFTLFFFFMM